MSCAMVSSSCFKRAVRHSLVRGWNAPADMQRAALSGMGIASCSCWHAAVAVGSLLQLDWGYPTIAVAASTDCGKEGLITMKPLGARKR